jgi:hypothetical protein
VLRAGAALAAGLLVVLAAFAWGTENETSTVLAGRTTDCGPAISASWLVAGTPDTTSGDGRLAEACRPVVQRARVGVLATMAAGALLALVGWSAHHEPYGRRRVGRHEVRPT